MNRFANNIFTILIVTLLLCSCAAKKKIAMTTSIPEPAVPEAPRWHSTLVSSANATATLGSQSIQANCQLMVVRDSMLTISVMPMLGIEMLRIEATPNSICIIDKFNRRFAITDYTTINRYVTPQVTWNDLQDLASGDVLEEGTNRHSWSYSAKGNTATLRLQYQNIQHNVPMRITTINKVRYTEINPQTFLQ